MDSSVLTVHAAQHAEGRFLPRLRRNLPVRTKTVVRDAPTFFYARQLSQQLRVDLVEVEVSARSIELLPNMIYHLDEPLVDPAVLSCHLQVRQRRSMGQLWCCQGRAETNYSAVTLVTW
ncbi:MAG: hypothetical protein IPM02_22430 [Betaproteobacteria bacterium]|nr:hypothetical protein [Betaproteobacteria bacterium]